MRPLTQLNMNLGELPNRRPSPSMKDFDDLEKQVGYSIPEPYKLFLEYANGGHPELDTLVTETGEWSIDHFFHLGGMGSHFRNVEWNHKEKGDQIPVSFLPIGADGGGNLFCLDLAETNAPVYIVLFDTNPSKCLKLANDFVKFINCLNLNPDAI